MAAWSRLATSDPAMSWYLKARYVCGPEGLKKKDRSRAFEEDVSGVAAWASVHDFAASLLVAKMILLLDLYLIATFF